MTKKSVKVIGLVFILAAVFVLKPATRAEAVEALELLPGLNGLKNSSDPDKAQLAGQLHQAIEQYGQLQNYRAIFHKTEIGKNGKMDDAEEIFFKFEKPFKIFMGWMNTRKRGLQVVYERGKHDNKLAIHQPGLLLGFAQVIFLPQDSPWVREGSASYDIEDAGIGTFLFGLSEDVLKAEKMGTLKVTVADDQFSVTLGDATNDNEFMTHRVETIFDQTSHLPVAMKLYDAQNQLTGEYAYRDLEINLTKDEAFKKHANRHLLRVYEGR